MSNYHPIPYLYMYISPLPAAHVEPSCGIHDYLFLTHVYKVIESIEQSHVSPLDVISGNIFKVVRTASNQQYFATEN